MTSGNPAKQPRPDGRTTTDQVTEAFPPSMSAVVTEVAASVVPFQFAGGKAIDLTIFSGPLELHLHFHPSTAEVIIEAIREAKLRAEVDIVPASLADMGKVARTNGHKNGQPA